MINISEKLQKVEYLSSTGYNLQISKYINDAFEIFKKNAWGFIGFTLLTLAISLLSDRMPYYLGYIIPLFTIPLSMGYVIVARKILRNESYSFSDFFKGYEKFIDLTIVEIIAGILSIVALVFLILPGIYLAISYAFVSLFIWFLNDGNIWESLERSRKLITKEWFSFFGFFLVIILLNIGGVICLGVGLLVTIPVSSIALYLCFEDLIGTDEEGDVAAEKVSILNS
jgi:hypothetical protein